MSDVHVIGDTLYHLRSDLRRSARSVASASGRLAIEQDRREHPGQGCDPFTVTVVAVAPTLPDGWRAVPECEPAPIGDGLTMFRRPRRARRDTPVTMPAVNVTMAELVVGGMK